MKWSTIAFSVYLGFTVLLVICLGIRAYKQDDSMNKKKFLQTVWSMKSIYGTVLVHLYDTATDIGVIVAWGLLTYPQLSNTNDIDGPSINMLPFLIASIVLMFIHRIVFAIYYYKFLYTTPYFEWNDIVWILMDVYIIAIAHASFKEQYTQPCVLQKNHQFWESVFESMPQLVLATTFLIETYNTDSKVEGSDMIIYFLSIAASIISLVTKYMWYDNNWVIPRALALYHKANKFPYCISYSYLARFVWRFSELMLRFIIFTLIWTVLGGLYLGIYLIINWFLYFVLEIYTKGTWMKHKLTQSAPMVAVLVMQSIIGILLRHDLLLNMIRFMDNFISLGIVAFISLSPYKIVQCDVDILCNDTENKYAPNNPYIMVMFVIGGIALVLELLLYVTMYTQNILTTEMGQGNYTIEDVKENKLGLTEQEQLLRQYHPLFIKRAKESKKQFELDLDAAVADNEMGFGNDLSSFDVGFNPMASGFPGLRRPSF